MQKWWGLAALLVAGLAGCLDGDASAQSTDEAAGAAAGAAQAGTDLLPNLVTLVPTDVAVRSCTYYEQTEQGASRCLRLSNAVGNIGAGPLEVRLDLADGALSALGLGQFMQRVYQEGGGYREQPVAGAEFHLTHVHFHYAGLAGFQLFEYDQATGERGDPVSDNKKSGFCFLDSGKMHDSPVPPRPRAEYDYFGCFVPDPHSWRMGISVGWFDLYTSGLDEQYVEISGVPDGVYELVSVADVEGTLEESDETDNEASVVLRLAGNSVTILEERGDYTLP